MALRALLLLALLPAGAADSKRFLAMRGEVIGSKARPVSPGAPPRIKVLTDMGFDDWGAFATMHAAGLGPESALATGGMMPVAFANGFGALLQSWGLETSVFRGQDGCWKPPCVSMSSLGWLPDYRSKLRDVFARQAFPDVRSEGGALHAGEGFWEAGGCTEKYTLLVLSPLSDLARALEANAEGVAGCIKEVVVSGSVFLGSDEGMRLKYIDGNTFDNLVGHVSDGSFTEASDAELNVASDAPGAHSVLESLARHGVRVTIIPLEVESIDRVGKQAILEGHKVYSRALQANLTTERVSRLCNAGRASLRPKMLERMACIHRAAGDVATLDMDAIVATYLLASGRELFSFQQLRVSLDGTSGITSLCRPTQQGCFEAQVATRFQAGRWFDEVLTPLVR